MSIGSVPTKLPLATFAKILGLHPLHFEGIEFTPDSRSQNFCDEAMLQYAWQESDRVGRDEIARAIADAEDMIESHLRWRLLPVWERDEWRMLQRPQYPEFVGYTSVDIRGRAQAVRAKWGYVRTGGIEAKVALDAGATIIWSDANGDGFLDTGTVTAAVTSAVEECEVEVYYPGHDGDPEYQIRPAAVTIAGLVATITFKRELAVIEDMLESLDPGPADYTNDNHFLSEVDVYRHYNDPATQVQLLWEPKPGGCGVCSGEGCGNCAYAFQNGCLHLRSAPKEGMLGWSPGTYDVNTNTFSTDALVVGRTPDIARLYYRAGNIAPTGCTMVMEPKWARVVTYLAASLLDKPLCGCDSQPLAYWREDLGLLSGGEGTQNSTYSFESRKAAGENGFGTRRGALYAWNRVVKDPSVTAVDFGTW